MWIWIGVIVLVLAIAGFLVVMAFHFGVQVGREMAETAVIERINKDPLGPGYEVVDDLYPHRAELMIAVPVREASSARILRQHWGGVAW